MELVEPTLNYVQQRLRDVDGDMQFRGAERAVAMVFGQWPRNVELEQVLVKTVVLNLEPAVLHEHLRRVDRRETYLAAWHRRATGARSTIARPGRCIGSV